jgi:hypothetical protein
VGVASSRLDFAVERTALNIMNRPYTLKSINKLKVDQEWFKKLKKLRTVLGLDIISGPWLAGGLVRRLATGSTLAGTDVDIFLADDAPAIDDKQLKEVTKITGIEQVQVIDKNRHPNVYTLLDAFGLTVCQFATDGEYVVHNLTSLKDHENKVLRQELKPACGKTLKLTKKLVDKYVSYGFALDDHLKKSYDSLPDQLGADAYPEDDEPKTGNNSKTIESNLLKAAYEVDLLDINF